LAQTNHAQRRDHSSLPWRQDGAHQQKILAHSQTRSLHEWKNSSLCSDSTHWSY
jgi:hypothetical protein